jgi:DnaJ-class molecular chaperone
VLTDKKKRQEYDLYGENAPGMGGQPGGGGGGQPGGPNPFQQYSNEGGGGFTFKQTKSGASPEEFFSGFNFGGGAGGMGGGGIEDMLNRMFGGMGGGGRSHSHSHSHSHANSKSGFGDPTGFPGGHGQKHAKKKQQKQPHKAGKEEKSTKKTNKQHSSEEKTSTSTSSSSHSKDSKKSSTTAPTGPVVHQVNCTLEELYNGTMKKLKVKDKVVQGPERVTVEKIFEIEVKAGHGEGNQFKFPPSADFNKEAVFEIHEVPHKYFVRSGNNLIWKCSLKKKQVEKGVKIKIPLLDGKDLLTQSKDYPQITDGVEIPFKGYGMPVKHHKGKKGDLIVHFEVK